MSNNKNVFFKNLQEIIDSLQSEAIKNSPNADIGRNSPFHDVAIQPPAQELTVLYEQLRSAILNQNPYTATESALIQLAKNQNLTRKGSTPSSGLVTVSSKVLPNNDIIIPAGTKFSTNSGRQVISITSTILPALADIDFPNNDYTVSPYFFINERAITENDTGERFGVDIPVITTESGFKSRIDTNQVVNFSGTPIAGIDEISNRIPITGGLDTESVFSLKTRIALSKLSRQLGSEIAYKSKVLEVLTIEDAIVIGQGHPLMKRDIVRGQNIGGKVDIYVIGQSISQTTQRVPFSSNATLQNKVREPIFLEKQPVLSIESVIGDKDGRFPASTYSLQKDIGTFTAGSTAAKDALVFNDGFDAQDQTITITYTYNQTLQNALDKINLIKSINADIAVFEALLSLVDFSITVRAKKGVSKGIVDQEVKNTIASYLSNFGLGQELKVSEVIALIQNLDVVDEVITKATTFGKRQSLSSQRALPAEPKNISLTEKNLEINEYLRLGSIIVVVQDNK